MPISEVIRAVLMSELVAIEVTLQRTVLLPSILIVLLVSCEDLKGVHFLVLFDTIHHVFLLLIKLGLDVVSSDDWR